MRVQTENLAVDEFPASGLQSQSQIVAVSPEQLSLLCRFSVTQQHSWASLGHGRPLVLVIYL